MSSLKIWVEKNCDFDSKNPTHYFWELTSHPHFEVPPKLLKDFYSEYLNCYLQKEILKIVETVGKPNYKLFLDIDIKYHRDNNNDISKEKMFEMFMKGIVKSFQKVFPEEKETFYVTGSDSAYTFNSFKKVNWKYGFHVFWNLSVNTNKHKKFISELLDYFSLNNDLSKDVLEFNRLEDIFDKQKLNLRLLYSVKSVECKTCYHTNNKKKNNKKLKIEKCKECDGSGVSDGRIHEYMGEYSNGALINLEKDDESKEVKLQRILNCSIRLIN